MICKGILHRVNPVEYSQPNHSYRIEKRIPILEIRRMRPWKLLHRVSRELIEFIELDLLTVGTSVGKKRKAAGRRDTCRQIKKDEFTQ